jgi:hypothetical protein
MFTAVLACVKETTRMICSLEDCCMHADWQFKGCNVLCGCVGHYSNA